MTLPEFNQLHKTKAPDLLAATCGSVCWQTKMLERMPFASEKEMVQTAVEIWYYGCSREDWKEAFSVHPNIGDTQSLAERFPAGSNPSGSIGEDEEDEIAATPDILTHLQKASELYEAKFGYRFIVFATGKAAPEMLRILQDRSSNNYEEELIIAMGEQLKITIQRFKKMMANANWNTVSASQLTTHVLDTALGKPAIGITVRLKHCVNSVWYTLAQGVTNQEGRVANFLPPEKYVLPGNYKMLFETHHYFRDQNIQGFYPKVEIDFTVTDDSHYHVPLLLSPFGYSTYRGGNSTLNV